LERRLAERHRVVGLADDLSTRELACSRATRSRSIRSSAFSAAPIEGGGSAVE
jgi:hypothetical protein